MCDANTGIPGMGEDRRISGTWSDKLRAAGEKEPRCSAELCILKDAN